MPTGLGNEEVWLCPSLGSNNANDLSGNGNNGTLQGNAVVASVSGAGGSHAFDLPNHGDYVETSYGFNGATQRAVSAWFYRDADSGISGIYSDDTHKTWLYLNNNGRVLARYGNSSGSNTSISNSSGGFSNGAWHHICLNLANGKNAIYVDNELIVRSTTNVGTSNGTSDYHGFFKLFSDSLRGDMDDIRLFSSALTESEITHLATSRGIESTPPWNRRDFTTSSIQFGTISSPSATLTLNNVQAGSCLVLSITTGSSVNRSLTSLADDVNGSWNAFDTATDGVAGSTRSWFGYINNTSSGTLVITPTFNSSVSMNGNFEIAVTEFYDRQVRYYDSFSNTASGNQYANSSAENVSADEITLAQFGINADVSSPSFDESQRRWPVSPTTTKARNLHLFRIGAQTGSRMEVSNFSNRYSGAHMAILEPTSSGPAAPAFQNPFRNSTFHNPFFDNGGIG